MRVKKMFRNFAGLVALALALAAGTSISNAQTTDSTKISDLLSQAKSHAILAEKDAATLESYTRSKSNWKSHAVKLEIIKDHINELGKLNQQMSQIRAEGSPWQQTAIDQIDPLLRNLADQLTTTINHLNDNQSQVHMQAYRDYVHASHELTGKMAQMIQDFAAYDEAKSKAEFLEQKLEISVADNSGLQP